jgi:CheY-like chemotaxis protein
MKTLIAEDDPVSRKVLELHLQRLGHEVVLTQDGEQAWEQLLAGNIQIIVSDWMMPRLDGVAFCRRVRERSARNYVYFILLTALKDRERYLEAMEAGVDDFLTKPLRHEELVIRLKVAQRILSFMEQVRDLRRLVPICSYCKRIRDDGDYWHQIESYLAAQTGADLTHGICPECYAKVLKPQIDAIQQAPRPHTKP